MATTWNQKALLIKRSLLNGYLKAQNLVAVDIYIDDGYTGTNFERPDFKKNVK